MLKCYEYIRPAHAQNLSQYAHHFQYYYNFNTYLYVQ